MFNLSIFLGISKKTVPVVLGRMSASTNYDFIRAELMKEHTRDGIVPVLNRLKAERNVLKDLQKQHDRYQAASCAAGYNLINRAQSGHSIGGIFWQTQRKTIEAIHPQNRVEFNENLDWLKARQKIAKELFSSYAVYDEDDLVVKLTSQFW